MSIAGNTLVVNASEFAVFVSESADLITISSDDPLKVFFLSVTMLEDILSVLVDNADTDVDWGVLLSLGDPPTGFLSVRGDALGETKGEVGDLTGPGIATTVLVVAFLAAFGVVGVASKSITSFRTVPKSHFTVFSVEVSLLPSSSSPESSD